MTDNRLPDELTRGPRPSYDKSEIFSDHQVRGGMTERPDDARIRNREQYGAVVTAYRHLRTAAAAMSATDGCSDAERGRVLHIGDALAARIHTYERANNLPPAPVTP